MDAAEQIAVLQENCRGARLLPESGQQVAFLPEFEFTHLGHPKCLDLLLVPFAHSGYENRLFLSEQLTVPTGKSMVWTQQTAIGRTWHAPSVRGIQNDWPWPAMVTGFLRAIG